MKEKEFDPYSSFERETVGYLLLLLIVMAMLCPIGVSFYFISLFINPVKFSDYLSLIIGMISMLVSLYFGVIFQFHNFNKIIKKVEKICNIVL